MTVRDWCRLMSCGTEANEFPDLLGMGRHGHLVKEQPPRLQRKLTQQRPEQGALAGARGTKDGQQGLLPLNEGHVRKPDL